MMQVWLIKCNVTKRYGQVSNLSQNSSANLSLLHDSSPADSLLHDSSPANLLLHDSSPANSLLHESSWYYSTDTYTHNGAGGHMLIQPWSEMKCKRANMTKWIWMTREQAQSQFMQYSTNTPSTISVYAIFYNTQNKPENVQIELCMIVFG